MFEKSIIINSQEFQIIVDLVNKKSSSLKLVDNILYFRISSKLSKKDQIKHFNNLLEKIKKKNIKSNPKGENFKKALNNKKFYFKNQEFLLELNENKLNEISFNKEKNSFLIPNNYLEIYDFCERFIAKHLILIFEKEFKEQFSKINKQTYNHNIKNLKLKYTKSKWGHCSQNNEIMISLKLLDLDYKFLFYVICHELSHVKHKNHSILFWQEVKKFCPNYAEIRKEMKNKNIKLF